MSDTLEHELNESGVLDADWYSEWMLLPTNLSRASLHIAIDDGAGGSHTAAGSIIIQGTNNKDETPQDIYFEDESTGTKATAVAVVAGTDVSKVWLVFPATKWIRVFFDRTGGDAEDQIRVHAAVWKS